mgnify:CR=1 FL=1
MKRKNKASILITGSSRGIGASLARLCFEEGYEVILHGQSKTKELLSLAEELNSKYLCFDLKNEFEIEKSLKEISKLNILINSAGINISKPFNDLSSKDWQTIYDVNVFGLVNVIKYAYPILKKNHLSKIINIASIKGTHSAVGRAAYASSKSAVINLTSSLAKEFAPNTIVNCVSPGFTNTKMTEQTWTKRIKTQVESILLSRMAETNEIAEVILFLCSEKCNYITGQNIIVDGGFSIKNV